MGESAFLGCYPRSPRNAFSEERARPLPFLGDIQNVSTPLK
jgi:hypothetical protein